jgi:hypothetical protein
MKILNSYMAYYKYFCQTNESTYETVSKLHNKLIKLKDKN